MKNFFKNVNFSFYTGSSNFYVWPVIYFQKEKKYWRYIGIVFLRIDFYIAIKQKTNPTYKL